MGSSQVSCLTCSPSRTASFKPMALRTPISQEALVWPGISPISRLGSKRMIGHVQIKTILLDDIFGFDPDVRLAPTNTFHLGFWFDNPQDAAALPSCHFDPTKPTPFNGEHKAGPFAMISVPDAKTGLGPLCTNPNNSTTPASCTL